MSKSNIERIGALKAEIDATEIYRGGDGGTVQFRFATKQQAQAFAMQHGLRVPDDNQVGSGAYGLPEYHIVRRAIAAIWNH